MKAGFSLQDLMRERRYANLGHLLPMSHIERAVEPGVSALPLGWPDTCIVARLGHSAIPRLGTGHDLSHFSCLRYGHVLAELHRRDVFGTRAFWSSPFRVGHRLALTQGVETDTLEVL